MKPPSEKERICARRLIKFIGIDVYGEAPIDYTLEGLDAEDRDIYAVVHLLRTSGATFKETKR